MIPTLMDQPGGGAAPGMPPPGAQLSRDGRSWWDGARWVAVPAPQIPAPPPLPPSSPPWAPPGPPPGFAAAPPGYYGQAPATFQPYWQPPPPPSRSGRRRGLVALSLVPVIAVCAIAGYLVTRPASTPAAHTYTDPGKHFSAAFPVTPLSTSQTLTEDGVDVTITMYEAQVSGSEGYMAGYAVYPQSVDTSNPTANLAGAVQGGVTAVNGTLLSQSQSTYQGFPSVDLLVSAGGYYIEYRFVLDGHSMFEIGIQSTQDPPPAFTAFANSLVILAP